MIYNPYSAILADWGFATGLCGNFDEGQRLFEKAVSFAEKINHRTTIGFAKFLYGILFAVKGDGSRAIGILGKAISDLEESQNLSLIGIGWAYLGFAHWVTGEYRTALEFSEKGLKIHSDLGLPFMRSLCHWSCSLAHFGLGNLEDAKIQAEQALKWSIANKEKAVQGWSSVLLGKVLSKADPGQIEAAEGHMRQGINLTEEIGDQASSSRGYLWLGEVYAESGRKEEALENIKKAETMFREMGMDYWLAKAQEALGKL
jgi:tetratricopeptide (TPR) repeat protein